MALPTASDNKWPKLILAETSAPSNPAASHRALYVDANHILRWKDSGGVDSPLAALNKWDGTTAPTANEDSGDGYSVGSRWIDTTNDKEYVCLDASVGAAVWTETTASGGSLGAWASYTPTWTLTTSGTTTLGNGTLTGFHKDLDANTCVFCISLVWGSTTSVSIGNAWEFALPHTASAHLQTVHGYILDTGTAYFAATGKIAASATKVTPIIAADSTPARLTSSTNPMTWATGDELVIAGVLRR